MQIRFPLSSEKDFILPAAVDASAAGITPALARAATVQSCCSAQGVQTGCTPALTCAKQWTLGHTQAELIWNLAPFSKLEALMPSKALFYTPRACLSQSWCVFSFCWSQAVTICQPNAEVKFRCCGNKGFQEVHRDVIISPDWWANNSFLKQWRSI